MRTKADYWTKDTDKFVFPVQLDKGSQFYSMRVIAIMEKFLRANNNTLTH